MLKNSFCHIPGIGPKYENRLWALGYHHWDAVFSLQSADLTPMRRARITSHIHESIDEFEQGNARFFTDRLPSDQHWRLFPEFRDSVAYIDIESTGTRSGTDSITTIALYDGSDVYCYVKDRNLDEFAYDIQRYKLIVTYNGKCFDIPFIEAAFDLKLEAAHVDLRYVLGSLGFVGGLKGCERQLGIDRGALNGVDGYFAILLWYDYEHNGNERALETLLAYNTQDVVNLEPLMVQAYNMKLRTTPFQHRFQRGAPARPPVRYVPDVDTIERLRRLGRGAG